MEILAVVVRYEMALESSETIRGLDRSLALHPELREAIHFLIWDNSPQRLLDPALPFTAEYRHSGRNIGVSGAYNEAAKLAREQGIRWMLLLDQDTALPDNFLQTMLAHGRRISEREEIAAIVPVVKVGQQIVSPMRSVFQGHVVVCDRESGVMEGEAFAINSGCLLRVQALERIGGFSGEFWLDYSDRYVFHQFFRHGFKVWRAADVEVEHEMTILDYDRLMAPWRYLNFIEAEGAFNDLYKSGFENAVQNLRLAVRAVRQRMRYKNPEFSRITARHLWTRLRVGRRRRVLMWENAQRWRSTAGAAS
jgi:GT2 family glycosyltransferase